MHKINDLQFFKSDTITLAKNLIGKWIVTNIDDVEVKAQICETEAYLGVNDSACHTYKGKRTERVEPMWQGGGTIYIYLCYGLHYLLNIASCDVGQPEAVLIRGVVGAPGPAKATKLLNINKDLNGQSIVNNAKICIMDDGKKYEYLTATRVGIDYALPKDRNAKLRFILKETN
ncbi:MAG: DNA-3-methyladenine glycosylase [Clostridia bacterium]|nr:DNA-3-methyladenine glycosylase [Clostridia bacterium]